MPKLRTSYADRGVGELNGALGEIHTMVSLSMLYSFNMRSESKDFYTDVEF